MAGSINVTAPERSIRDRLIDYTGEKVVLEADGHGIVQGKVSGLIKGETGAEDEIVLQNPEDEHFIKINSIKVLLPPSS